jgi:uncharacterized protein (DUF736 family)
MSTQKDNSGALFVNDRKEKETHPDYKGNALVEGVEYWLSGWKNQTKDGKVYLSIKLEPKDSASGKPVTTFTTQGSSNPNDPF